MATPVDPRIFFLNERHELAPKTEGGGGNFRRVLDVDWVVRAKQISSDLANLQASIRESGDPLSSRRFYMVALAESVIMKESRGDGAAEGRRAEHVDFRSSHGRALRRLGLDVVEATSPLSAVVHAAPAKFERLMSDVARLPTEGVREQARWAPIHGFGAIPMSYRVDLEWLDSIRDGSARDVMVELQPLIVRSEAEDVIRHVTRRMSADLGERVTSRGVDFCGRFWIRGRIHWSTIESLASATYSIQSIHAPLLTSVAARGAKGRGAPQPAPSPAQAIQPIRSPAPCVAVVDTGIHTTNPHFGNYRRAGGYSPPGRGATPLGHHGSRVASRVVFGNLNFVSGSIQLPRPSCQVYDVMVAVTDHMIDDKAVLPAMQAVAATMPDIRVFNLSFGDDVPLNAHNPVDRREMLLILQDLDNFAFFHDVIIVVAAGNTRPGVGPTTPYPHHSHDPNWALGAWACGFNTLTCGAFVDVVMPNGMVDVVGAPSPFTRVGPGLCGSPVPAFGAAGGNSTEEYNYGGGLGVWTLDGGGTAEDVCGTSFAAPLLAREAAFILHDLRQFCVDGTHPFAALAKAYMFATARRPRLDDADLEKLAKLTIGRGLPSASHLLSPSGESAIVMWQGVLEQAGEVVRVEVPIPSAWLRAAGRPVVRVVCSWDAPVNEGMP